MCWVGDYLYPALHVDTRTSNSDQNKQIQKLDLYNPKPFTKTVLLWIQSQQEGLKLTFTANQQY
jgi:hypothetical protein